jgi:IS1 family transposase
MNILSRNKQVEVIAALTEGVSIRATERLTGVHRDTIMRLGARIGRGCAGVHDHMMRNLNVARIELDEAWSYVGKKQRKVTPEDGANVGDQYVFLALDASRKATLSYRIGKRDGATTEAFCADLRKRVLNRPEISSDAFSAYPWAIELAFGTEVDYGQIVKAYHGEPAIDAARHIASSRSRLASASAAA